jgi:hypothetical protein
VSLCGRALPGTCYVAQADLKLEIFLLWLPNAGITGKYHHAWLQGHFCYPFNSWLTPFFKRLNRVCLEIQSFATKALLRPLHSQDWSKMQRMIYYPMLIVNRYFFIDYSFMVLRVNLVVVKLLWLTLIQCPWLSCFSTHCQATELVNPPDFNLLSSWDYRHEPLAPIYQNSLLNVADGS